MIGLDKTEINKRFKRFLEGATPQLKCIVTGKSRITNNDFLKGKEDQFGSIDNYMQNYICREALSLFKEGKSYVEVRKLLDIPENFPNITIDNLKIALNYYFVDYKLN